MEVSRARNFKDKVSNYEIQMLLPKSFNNADILRFQDQNNHNLLFGQLAMIKKNDRENSNIPHVMGKRERIKKESSWLISNGFAFVLISARNMTGNCSKPLSILLGFRSWALIEHRSIIWKIFLKIETSPNQQIEMLAFRFEHTTILENSLAIPPARITKWWTKLMNQLLME